MRDNSYLKNRLYFLWRNYFPDVSAKEPVEIRFGRKAKYRFGSIRYCYASKKVHITVNGRFQDKRYPAEIIDHTVAHEMVHYAQGFPTPGPRLSRYPHRGGVVNRELKERHLHHLVYFYDSWVKSYINSL